MGFSPNEVIDRIRHLCAEGAQVDDLARQVQLLHSFCPNSIGSRLDTGQKLYRATKHHRSLPEHFRDLSYPPVHLAKTVGRCNRIGQPMFYCTGARDCAGIERSPGPGTLVILAEWQLLSPLVVHDLGYSPTVLQRAGASRELDEGHQAYLSGLNDDEKCIREFIALAFTDPTDKQYSLTAAITEAHIKSEQPIAGVIYPSIAFSGDADNLALLPSFVDRHMRLMAAQALEVTRFVGDQQFQAVLIADLESVDCDGSIIWRPQGERVTFPGLDALMVWNGRTLRIFASTQVTLFDGRSYPIRPGFQIELGVGQPVVRDAQGNLVEPST